MSDEESTGENGAQKGACGNRVIVEARRWHTRALGHSRLKLLRTLREMRDVPKGLACHDVLYT